MSYSTKNFPGWRGAVRKVVAMALLGAAGAASAGYVTFNDGVERDMDAIFSQAAFGGYGIDIRFNAPLSVVSPTLLDINSDAEFSGGGLSLSSLSHTLGVPNFTVAIFFVDKISDCGGTGNNIIGCGSNPGGLIALKSDAAAGTNGAVLMAHELGHNLGLRHLAVDDNLMNASITGRSALTTAQVGSFLNLTTGASLNPIVQNDNGQFYVSITPIAVLAAAAVPEPQTWAMMLAGLLGVAGWARRRPACAAG